MHRRTHVGLHPRLAEFCVVGCGKTRGGRCEGDSPGGNNDDRWVSYWRIGYAMYRIARRHALIIDTLHTHESYVPSF